MSKRGRQTDEESPNEVDNYLGETELLVGSDEEDVVDFDKEEADLNEEEGGAEEEEDEDADIDAYFAKLDPTADARQMDTQAWGSEGYAFGAGFDDTDAGAGAGEGIIISSKTQTQVQAAAAAPASMWWHTAMNESERAAVDARAEAGALTMEPVSASASGSLSQEKLVKIATKRATQRITRAPSSFIVYSTKRRSELPASMSFKDKAQLISQEYKNLNDEQTAVLEEKCAVDKQAYMRRLELAIQEELEILKANPEGLVISAGTGSERAAQVAKLRFQDIKHNRVLAFPLAKIKRIIKINPEVKNISKEGSVMIAKAAELFLSYVALKGTQVASLRGGKSIQEKDFIHMLHTTAMCDFLREDFPRRQGEDGTKGNKKPVARAVKYVDANGQMVEEPDDKAKVEKKNKFAAAAAGTRNIAGFFGKAKEVSKSNEEISHKLTEESQATMTYPFPIDMDVGSADQ